MTIRYGAFFLSAAFLLTQSALAATPPKPAKAPVAKAAKAAPKSPVAKPAVAKAAPKAAPAAPKATAKASSKPAAKPAAQTVYRLPAGGAPTPVSAKSNEPPPGVRVDPVPGTQAVAPAAVPKPAAQAVTPAKPKAKKVAQKPGKKKQLARSKTKVKIGRAALTPMERIDQGQLATDHLAGAERKSVLDLLVSYKETLREGDLETAGVLMRLIVNETPRHDVVTAVNDLIGMPLDTQDTEILMDLARADRADAVAGAAAAQAEADKVGSPLGERIHAAHAAIDAAPRTSRLDALAAYKHAVLEDNAQAAAIALSGVVQGPISQEAVNTANALLGVRNIILPGQLAAVN
jgi:hypothetical protein